MNGGQVTPPSLPTVGMAQANTHDLTGIERVLGYSVKNVAYVAHCSCGHWHSSACRTHFEALEQHSEHQGECLEVDNN